MGTNQRIEDDSMPQRNCEARDEMNLAEFPLCALAHRLRPEVKTLRFEDCIQDKSTGKTITRQLTVTGSDAYGLPTGMDDEVLLGLIQLTRLRDFADRKVFFTRHELIRILGWRDDSKSYARVEASLNRWTGVTLYYHNSWWAKARQCWLKESFHILENVWLCHRGDPPPDVGLPSHGTPMSAFVWNEVIFRSFTQGNLKSIDFEFYKSLQSAVAKRLYRFLDKRFWHRSRLQFDLRELCCEHVGLSRSYDTGNMKRKLISGVSELEERGFLTPLATEERFSKVRRGKWCVVFEQSTITGTSQPAETNSELASVTQALIDRGISAHRAVEIANGYPVGRIQRQMKCFDWMLSRRDRRMSRNAAGFLIAAIRRDFTPPPDFQTHTNAASAPGSIVERKPKPAAISRPETDARVKERELIQQFWRSISEHERLELEVLALANAGSFHRAVIERGGAFAESTKKTVLDAFTLKEMSLRKFSLK